MHKNARSKAHKCRIRHKGFNLGADFGMERVLITNGHLARFPRPIPSAPKIMEFQSYFQSFEMSPDVTRCHRAGAPLWSSQWQQHSADGCVPRWSGRTSNRTKSVKSRQSNSFSFCNWRQRVQHGLCTHLTWIAHNLTRHESLLNKNAYLFVLHIFKIYEVERFFLCFHCAPLILWYPIQEFPKKISTHTSHTSHTFTRLRVWEESLVEGNEKDREDNAKIEKTKTSRHPILDHFSAVRKIGFFV